MSGTAMATGDEQVAANSADMAIYPLWLKFRDRAFEQQFYNSWLRATRGVNRIWSLCGVVFYTLYTALLLATLPESSQELLWLRYGVALPIIVLSQAPAFFPERLKRWLGPSYMSGMITGFGVALLLFAAADPSYRIAFLAEMTVIFVFAQHYNRILFVYSAAFTLIAGSATIAVVAVHPGLSDIPALPLSVAIAAVGLVGVFSSYTRETFVRRNYRSIQALQQANRRSAELAARATAASEAKSRFLAIMNHELRTPLNAIIGYADMITHGMLGDTANPKVSDAVADIGDSGRRLQEIVEDVLSLARATNGSAELSETRFDCAALLEELSQSFAPECAKRSIALADPELQHGLYLFADRRMVRHMLASLLSNALKFTADGGRIGVAAKMLSTGELAIEVSDTGIGIAPDKLDVALSAFGQEDDGLDRRYAGIGIGLPLIREFVALHGGTLILESEPGVGTRARLSFPPHRVATNESTQTAAA